MKKSKKSGRGGRGWLVLALMTCAAFGAGGASVASEEGIALAIVYDTSGSMNDPVRGAQGQSTAKYLIANRALSAIVDRLQTVATPPPGGTPRKIQTGLITFNNGRGIMAVKFGAFDPEAWRAWMRQYSGPNGNTPLGDALRLAGQTVLSSPLARKHVLVVTDGVNTAGPDPAGVLPSLKSQAARNGTGFSVHFVAFDVAAKVFDGVKKLGATVVSAADEKQLNTQLGFILEKKILLEDEEPPAARGKEK